MRPVALSLLLGVLPVPLAAQTYLVVVSGLGGEPKYSERFHTTSTTLLAAAGERMGIARQRTVYLAEQPARDPNLITARSTKEEIVRVLTELAGRAESNAIVGIVLVGHGSASRGVARFNLPGPDLTASEMATLLDRFPTQSVVVVNTASASGGWIEALSRDRRTVITATRSGIERDESYFGEHFAAAFANDGADTDKNGRVSLLEAFEYARVEVGRVYEMQNRMLTEHALLDDNGDGRGSLEPARDGGEGGDGAVAAALHLDERSLTAAAGDSVLASLQHQQDSLEQALASLRPRRETMPTEEYEQRLEQILLEIARVGRAIRQHQAGNEP